MEINTIIKTLKRLEAASLYRTPKDLEGIIEPWFNQFRNMPEDQFWFAIDEIIKKETVWPAIATVYRYTENWQKDYAEKKCPYCEDGGLLLIKTKGMHEAYACKCPVGNLRQKNLKIAFYESLGIPWPEIDKLVRRSDKMTASNQKRIDEFLGRVGRKMPDENYCEWDELIDVREGESG